MQLFKPGGPPRFAHQRQALRKTIATRGITALLMDPGVGKSAVAIDYACLLALKSPTREARVLVLCPLVAMDTWVLQSRIFASEQVDVWAEATGGSRTDHAEILASRGVKRYARPLSDDDKRMRADCGPRGLFHQKSWAILARRDGVELSVSELSYGPDAVGQNLPRVVLEVVNYDVLSSVAKVTKSQTVADMMVNAVERFAPDLVVCDEGHKLRGHGGNTSRLMARVARRVPRRMILTGTVMPHSPMDVFAQWRFLEPTAFGEMYPNGSGRRDATWGSFMERYAVLGGWMGREITGYRNLDDMQTVMARNAVVVRKEEALDLPPTQDVVVPVHLDAAERKAYVEMRDLLRTELATGAAATVTNRLTRMMRLRQITSGYLPDDADQITAIGDSKVATIASLVHDTLPDESRVVIFALFTEEIHRLGAVLSRSGTTVEVISGATTEPERRAIRERFGDLTTHPERIVLVAQIATMSLAVNELVTANHCIFASMSQRRDDWIQGKGRLDRQGQTRPVTFWHVLAPKTVDEVIYQSHLDGTDLESAMLRHVADQQ